MPTVAIATAAADTVAADAVAADDAATAGCEVCSLVHTETGRTTDVTKKEVPNS